VSTITVRAARKCYGETPVLLDVDLTVPAGSITAILGQSGSGKTTLLRSIAGFERLDAGSITIGATVVDDARTSVHPQHRGIGYVPQDGGLFPHLRVHANIGFGLHRSERGRVSELVDMLGLQSLEGRFPHQLSGGQRQRVALARALAPAPAVVLLDEPFSSLDASLRASLREEVTRVLRAVGATTIIVTHDRDEALTMADQIALLRHGRIGAVGSPRDLYTNPRDAATAAFLGTANLVPARVIGGRLHCPLPTPTRLIEFDDGAYTLLLRPEHLAIAEVAVDGATPATVVSVSYQGSTSELRVQMRDDTATTLVAEVAGHEHVKPGQTVWVRGTRADVLWPSTEARW
jgi:iron(III) transport system ATP-binding protein